ncbi:MAG: recombination protein RecR [SAR116 cluster bacterium]|jgi:recombination protein RecR|nr:recombination protein RecR [SAR116 cluster bacterium]|tara:strand:- start:865 stop:1461 length:597 start_codon:yes stop_codon:yes gene_type:complete
MNENILESLIKRLSKLPGLGQRSARRIVFDLLKDKHKFLKPIIEELKNVDENIKNCETCGNIDVSNQCNICRDPNRNRDILCIVENIPDLWALERSGIYNGLYHVLGGVLSAIDGINPRQLNIPSLESRVSASNKTEIIIAISATLDGQTTAHYLFKLLSKYGNKITRLAHGVPIGGELDYLDEGTIIQAMKGRIKFD